MPDFGKCLRITFTLPLKYDEHDEDEQLRGKFIEPEKFIDVQHMLTRRYKGLNSLPNAVIEGWWEEEEGIFHPPENNWLIDVTTGRLSDSEINDEKAWILDELYEKLKCEFRQKEIFMLIQVVERVFEI